MTKSEASLSPDHFTNHSQDPPLGHIIDDLWVGFCVNRRLIFNAVLFVIVFRMIY